MTDELVRERRGNVLIARLNRPEARNSLNGALLSALSEVVDDAESDPEIRVVVLTGTGDRAFCSGMDLRDFSNVGSGSLSDPNAIAGFYRLLHGEFTVPIVGAANATAVAGGFELLLACDIIVASELAKFGLPEVKRGLFATGGGIYLGTRLPLGIALELTMTGDSIDAGRAYELGLVNKVVAPDEVLPSALDYAERIAANGPLGVTATKELVRLAVIDRARAAARKDELQDSVFRSADAREGAMAFVEKRAPVWTGT